MLWIALLGLFLFSGASFWLARRKATASAAAGGRRPHSRPAQQVAYVAIWAFVPAFLLLAALIVGGSRIETALLAADLPAAVEALPVDRQELFVQDAHAVAEGHASAHGAGGVGGCFAGFSSRRHSARVSRAGCAATS